MLLQLDQLSVGHCFQIRPCCFFGVLRHDAIHSAAVRKIDRIATDVRVVPVQDIDTTFRADLDTETDPRQVVRGHEVVTMSADKAGTIGLHDVGQDSMLMNIAHEQAVAILFRKCVCQIESRAAMS